MPAIDSIVNRMLEDKENGHNARWQVCLRGACRTNFWVKLEFCPNEGGGCLTQSHFFIKTRTIFLQAPLYGTCRIIVLCGGKKEGEGKFEGLEEPSPLEGSLCLS